MRECPKLEHTCFADVINSDFLPALAQISLSYGVFVTALHDNVLVLPFNTSFNPKMTLKWEKKNDN